MDRRKQIIGWLKDILDKNLKGISFRAFIFGSQANKLVLIRSDIDLGIMADDKITIQQLARIQADIEALPMLYKIDLVNFNEVDEQFKSVALKNVESL
ncbi:MAG: polymerase beta domain protein region [Mucilaginibacter sp.]|nr:polymerase beta domain protein region [Mucilaginibacter sp.]